MTKLYYSFVIPVPGRDEPNLSTKVFMSGITIRIDQWISVKQVALVDVELCNIPPGSNITLDDYEYSLDLFNFVIQFELALAKAGYLQIMCYPAFIKVIEEYILIHDLKYEIFDDYLFKALVRPKSGQRNSKRKIHIPAKKA